MIPPSTPTITPEGPADHRGAASLRTPTRAELEGGGARPLKQGLPTKADLWLLDRPGGTLVVKDFGKKRLLTRLLGRFQISRECRAYRRLGPRPFLPRFIGRIDAHALALEWIAGEQLSRSTLLEERGAELLAELRTIVGALHEAGLTHLDLRGRANVLVDVEGRVRVLDLASAVWFRPRSLPHRLFFGPLATTDEAALLKWKRLLGAGPYTAEEQAFLDRFGFWRMLWPFNRKGFKRPPS